MLLLRQCCDNPMSSEELTLWIKDIFPQISQVYEKRNCGEKWKYNHWKIEVCNQLVNFFSFDIDSDTDIGLIIGITGYSEVIFANDFKRVW